MFTLNCHGHLLSANMPVVMGIINTTPDSFHDSSRKVAVAEIVQEAELMLHEGADILDIGGQSTRPGSDRIGTAEELKRVIPVIQAISKKFPGTILSIDTYSSEVAAAAVDAGASIVNDISAGNMDAQMIDTVAALKVPYVCMHMQGTPATMQKDPHYNDVAKDVLDFFIAAVDTCKQAGIVDVIIDPGFGFGKNIEHNFSLLKKMEVLHILHKPILAGISRKSTIYKTLHTTVDKALNGTTVLNTIALMKGASILRVHDVKEAMEAVKIWEAVNGSKTF